MAKLAPHPCSIPKEENRQDKKGQLPGWGPSHPSPPLSGGLLPSSHHSGQHSEKKAHTARAQREPPAPTVPSGPANTVTVPTFSGSSGKHKEQQRGMRNPQFKSWLFHLGDRARQLASRVVSKLKDVTLYWSGSHEAAQPPVGQFWLTQHLGGP